MTGLIYVFDRPDHLTSIVTAKSGTYSEQEGWVLHDVVEETVPTLPKESREQTQARVERKVMKSMVWGKSLDGNIFGLLMIKPEDMSLQELHYYIEYLKENGQTYKRFDTGVLVQGLLSAGNLSHAAAFDAFCIPERPSGRYGH